MHQAAAKGQIDQVRALTEKGADINRLDRARGTPLVVAIRSGHAPVARYLIEHGANVNTDVPSTPLYFAAEKGQEGIVTLLLAKGADVNHQDGDGDVPLHGAARGIFTSVVSLLVKAGANVDVTNKAGWTPLNVAASRARVLQPTKIATVLLDAGAKMHVVPGNAAVTGKTIGIYASYLKAKGRESEANAAYLEAKGYLEKGTQEAGKREKAAARGSFWASVFEPMPQTPGSTYHQGAIQQSASRTMGTLVTGGRSSSDFEKQESAARHEVVDLEACIAECEKNTQPDKSRKS